MPPLHLSRQIHILGVSVVFVLVLLWVTNTFLALPFDLDPRLLRRPAVTAVSETGFEVVEALVNDDGGGGFGAFQWNTGGNKAEGDDEAPKVWFFGKAGAGGGEEGPIVGQASGEPLDDVGSEKSMSLTSSGVVGVTEQFWSLLPTAATTARPIAVKTSAEEWFRLLATASAVEHKAAETTTGIEQRNGTHDVQISSINAAPAQTNPSTSKSSISAESVPDKSATGRKVKGSQLASVSSSTTSSIPASMPLILYAFSASDWALPNLRFFLTHALHEHATFIFILNGALPLPTGTGPPEFEPDPRVLNATSMITAYASGHSNIKIVKRPNTCYDLGAFAEVLLSPNLTAILNLTAPSSMNMSKAALYSLHSRFVLLNTSIRGPFIPFWSRECWSSAYLRPINDGTRDWKGRSVKVVGMTMNCVTGRPRHLQSMILATDSAGMGVLLGLEGKTSASPRTSENASQLTNIGLNACPATYDEAVNIEVSLTDLLLASNYTVSAMMALAHGSEDYLETCTSNDVNYREGAYDGGDLGVWETMWIKTRWGVDGEMVERISGWLYGAAEIGKKVEGDVVRGEVGMFAEGGGVGDGCGRYRSRKALQTAEIRSPGNKD